MFRNSLLFQSFSHYISYNIIRYFCTRLPMGESKYGLCITYFSLFLLSHEHFAIFGAKEAPITEDAADAVDSPFDLSDLFFNLSDLRGPKFVAFNVYQIQLVVPLLLPLHFVLKNQGKTYWSYWSYLRRPPCTTFLCVI